MRSNNKWWLITHLGKEVLTMKKIVIILSAILLVVALAVPSFAAGFTPSVEQKGAPTVVSATDADGNAFADGEVIVTPVSAADSDDGKILLVRENNGTWSLPGGWCDVDLSVAENTEKEVLEETGLSVHCKKLIAVQDWRRHNRLNCPYGIMKFFVLCEYDSGEFKENIETTETRLFDRNVLPDNLADEKTTAEQIRLCFEYYDNPHKETCLE